MYETLDASAHTFADWVRLGCFWEVGESAKKTFC